MSAFLAYFHFVNNQPIKALNLMDSIPSANPYLYAYESMKAEIFTSLGTRDSALYYAKLAHEGLPLNVRHFQQYIQELAYIEDSKTINEVFKKRDSYRDFQFYKYYLAYIIKFKDEQNTPFIDSIANIAIQRFPNNDEIKAIASFVLFGQENVEKSYALSKEGEKFFNTNDFEYALQAFKKASELNPGDYTFIESIGMSYIKLNQFEAAIPYFKKVIDAFDIKDGKSEYGLAICLKETGNLKEACSLLSKSIDMGFQPAYRYFSINCK
jgi:tetratricopeptide (TPR) repeat protein